MLGAAKTCSSNSASSSFRGNATVDSSNNADFAGEGGIDAMDAWDVLFEVVGQASS